MKNAWLIPLRYLLRLLVCIAFALIVLYCVQLARGTSVVQSLGYSLHETIVIFPFLVLIGLFLISFSPLRRPGNLPLSFFLICICSSLLLSLGVKGLDSLSVKMEKAQPLVAAKLKPGTIVKQNDAQAWYVLGFATDGKTVQGLVSVDFNLPGAKLSFREHAPLPELKVAVQPPLPAIVDSIMKDAAGISAFLRQKDLRMRLFTALIVAFFFCTLWVFPRLTKWPLFGALITLLVFRLALLFTAGTVSGDFATFMGHLFPASIGRWLPYVCLGVVGALFLLLDVVTTAFNRNRAGGPA